MVTTLERASNRLIRAALCAGLAPSAFALLETTGRRTGLPRHTRWEKGWTAMSSGWSPRIDLDPPPEPE